MHDPNELNESLDHAERCLREARRCLTHAVGAAWVETGATEGKLPEELRALVADTDGLRKRVVKIRSNPPES